MFFRRNFTQKSIFLHSKLKFKKNCYRYRLHLQDKEADYLQKKQDGSAYEIQETKTEIRLLQKKIGLQEKEQELIEKRRDFAAETVIVEIKDQVKDLRARVKLKKMAK